jgi:hypothetical protein
LDFVRDAFSAIIDRGLMNKTLKRGIIHPLPAAPLFTGREKELEALRKWWEEGGTGVLSLVGLGGSGKTAIAAEFLKRIVKSKEVAPAGLFVWSFYVEQDPNTFLKEAYRYFSGGESSGASGAGALYMLTELLEDFGRGLIIMDGLERVQREAREEDGGGFGELEGPLLKQIVKTLSDKRTPTACLITSRYPVADLKPWMGNGYQQLNLNLLQNKDAIRLLKRNRVKGTKEEFVRIVEEYGSHALTLDHLGGLLREYHSGKAAEAFELPDPGYESTSREGRPLARVLAEYERVLTEKEQALIGRISLFRFGSTEESLYALFCSRSADKEIAGPLKRLTKGRLKAMLARLEDLHILLREGEDSYTIHPIIRDLFYAQLSEPGKMHGAVRQHFVNLALAPGRDSGDGENLAMLEEVVFHSVKAGQREEAIDVLESKLNFGAEIFLVRGELERAVRIMDLLQGYPPADFVGALCRKYQGELKKARQTVRSWLSKSPTKVSDESFNLFRFLRAILLLDRGLPNLLLHEYRKDPEIYWEESEETRTVVRIAHAICPTSHGYTDSARMVDEKPRNNPRILLTSGVIALQRSPGMMDELRGHIAQLGSESPLFQALFDIAESLSLETRADLAKRGELIDSAESWILSAGSFEHLILLHLAKGRLLLDHGELKQAGRSLKEGATLARRSGFGLFFQELRLAFGRLRLIQARAAGNNRQSSRSRKDLLKRAARNCFYVLSGARAGRAGPAKTPEIPLSRLAVPGALHPGCGYVWAEADAHHLLGEILGEMEEREQALAELRKAMTLRRRLNSSEVEHTEQVLIELLKPR